MEEFLGWKNLWKNFAVEELVEEFCRGRTCGRILPWKNLGGRILDVAEFWLRKNVCCVENFGMEEMSGNPIKIQLHQRKNFWGGRTCGRIFGVEELVEEFLRWKNLWKNFWGGRTCGRILPWKNLWKNFAVEES